MNLSSLIENLKVSKVGIVWDIQDLGGYGLNSLKASLEIP